MTVRLLGLRSLGQSVPLATTATGVASAALLQSLAPLQARVVGLVALQANLVLTPPSLAQALAAAQALVAGLLEALAQGLPGVDFQLAGVATLLAELGLQVAAIETSLALVAALEVSLSMPGIYAYSLDGPVGPDANELSNLLSGGLPDQLDPEQPVIGILLLAAGANLSAKAALTAAFGL